MKFLFSTNIEPSVKMEQVKMLFQQGIAIQLLGIVTSIVCIFMLWPVVDQAYLLGWFALMVAITAARLLLTQRFSCVSSSLFSPEQWGLLYIAGTFVSGVVWGSLALFYTPDWDVPYQVFLFVVFTGIIAGAFNTNSSVLIAYPAFYLPVVVALMAVMLQEERTGYYELAMLFVIYIVLMHVSSLKFHRRLTHSLEVRFANEELAAELARSNAKLKELAEKDELTHLFNRRSLDRALENEWKRHYRNKKSLSMLFIDIDFFKQYNDTYGHEGGDRCLVRIAEVLTENTRRVSDMATRYGGEEFAVILPETDAAGALAIAEKIRMDTKELKIVHEGSSVDDYVTLSVGVATMVPVEPGNADLLRLRADSALYDAKKQGRDRVVQAAS